MTLESGYVIEPLSTKHNKREFSCGVDSLDRYLKEQASQDAKRHLSVTFVLSQNESSYIFGYYTLSSISIALDSLPDELAKKLPWYTAIPATLLGRLAVQIDFHGKLFGEHLLVDALHRSYKASEEVASWAVVVDALNNRAVSIYRKFDFLDLPGHPLKLFLPMATIRQLRF